MPPDPDRDDVGWAMILLQKAETLGGSRALIDFHRAGIATKEMGHEYALELYKRSIASNPQFVPARIEKALLLKSLKGPKDALASLDASVKAFPNDIFLLNTFASFLRDQCQYDHAMAVCMQAIASIAHSNERSVHAALYYTRADVMEKMTSRLTPAVRKKIVDDILTTLRIDPTFYWAARMAA